MGADARDVGHFAEARTVQGILYAAGYILNYAAEPTVVINDPDKGHVRWLAHLTTVPSDYDPSVARTELKLRYSPERELVSATIAAERARIVAAVATPDSDLLAALIGINESAKLMREWFLAIVNDEDNEDG